MRHIPLEGCNNLRDLGGYATTDGRIVQHGRVFRGDELCSLTDSDLGVLNGLGIRVVFDLRNDRERMARPSRLPVGVRVVARQTKSTTAPTAPTLDERIAGGDVPKPDDEEFAGVYIGQLTHLAPEFRQVVELAADADTQPLLFHCVGGKDRTGMAAAIVLGLLGVPDETILDDYELTTRFGTPRRMETYEEILTKYPEARDDVRTLMSARRPVLAKALAHLHTTWGGYDTYATDALDVTVETIERLRATLLV